MSDKGQRVSFHRVVHVGFHKTHLPHKDHHNQDIICLSQVPRRTAKLPSWTKSRHPVSIVQVRAGPYLQCLPLHQLWLMWGPLHA